MKYDRVNPISREEAIAAFASGDLETICDSLVRITFHDPDWQWVQAQCIVWARHPNADVRGLAVTCLGHLARIHAKLDLERVSPLLKELVADPDVSPRVDDALDDIEMFVDGGIRKCILSKNNDE
jgi:hypothetical protein